MMASAPRSAKLALAVSVVLLGCDGGDSVSDASERFARRFIPRDDSWRLESTIPEEPQATPSMVIWELTAYRPGSEASDEQRAAATEIAARCERVARAKGWFDFQQGLRDGFRLMANDRRHYYNEEFVFDDAILDCERPEFLMYYGTPRGKQLVGLMFYAREPLQRGPQIGGPETIWHYHVWNEPNCLLRGMLNLGRADKGRCERGSPSFRSPEMLHIWFLDHPQGRFATSMWVKPELVRAMMEQRAGKTARPSPAP
jgi:hypothetical protein